MRPLHLKIKGFTAFRDEQELDFRELDLFSLWGPTGSGKSSVLDAITFALYGKVERVEGPKDVKISDLITHGQPRMAVTLDFEIAGAAYRITRTNSATGSKVRLERKEGEDFVTFGEGADSVTEVNRLVPQLIGLDYNAFTRSVVLPQGKFAEFLSGDAKKRRDILTELLGLEMFGRMAQRSREIAMGAKSQLDAKQGLLASEYAGIDEKAVAEAEAQAKRLQAESKATADAESLLEELAQEADEQTRKARVLVELGEEVNDLRESFQEHAGALEGQGRQLEKAGEVARVAREEMKARDKEHTRLAKERGRLEEEFGTLEDLADLRGQVMSLRTLERDAQKAARSAAEQTRVEAAAKKALKEQDAAVEKAEAKLEKARASCEKKKQEHDTAHRHDLVGALTQDLAEGDPCPVCERPLEAIPEAEVDFTAAKKALAEAQAAEQIAQDSLAAVRTEHVRASQIVTSAAQRVQECVAEEKEKLSLLEEAREQLAALFQDASKDPLKEIEGRQEALREVVKAKEEAVKKLTIATSEDRLAQEALSTIKTEAAAIKGAIESAPLSPLSERATEALGRTVKIKLPSKLPTGAAELAGRVNEVVEELGDLRTSVADEAQALVEQSEALVEKARAALPSEFEHELAEASVKEMLTEVRKLCRNTSQQAVLAEKEAKTIQSQLEKRRALETEVQEHRKEQAVYSALAKELKNDRIVQFLQAEALAVLAATAGEHLKDLSDGRYRLVYEDDRFYVVDGWNGDEKRSVRTLSGGETFLASLGLALALSEQVQMLAVTERARLESLFLDEGFGSLDAETVDVVVSAISRLGSDGRLVGVITHVAEVAESMPVRIEVIKGQRGSKIKVPGEAEVIPLQV